MKKIISLSLAAIMSISIAACSNTNKTLEITSVSDIQQINAPDGVTLNVSVNDPSLVQSYQWQIARAEIVDDDGNLIDYDWCDLDGSSASTDTLIKPSVDSSEIDTLYRCMITDKKGNVIYSDLTGFEILNQDQPLNCIMLGEIAIRAGESVDLADTPYGSGTISLNDTGDKAIMKDLHFDNSHPIYDLTYSSQGFCYCDYNTPIETFTLEVQGDCSINNVLYQEDYLSSGLAVLFNEYGQETAFENAKITGDGTLSIKGGQALIYCDVNLEVDCDLIFDSYDDHFTDGIRIKGNAYVHDCKIESDNLNGRVVFTTNGQVNIENCDISTDVNVPRVSVGAANYRAISGAGDVVIDHSDIKLNTTLHSDWLTNGLGQVLGIYTESTVSINDSNIKMDFLTEGENENLYNLMAMFASEGLTMNDSELEIKSNTPNIINGTAINGENLSFINSKINIDLVTSGIIYGIADTGKSILENSELNIIAKNGKKDEDNRTFGMMVYDLEFEGKDSSIKISADDDIAFGIYLGYGDDELSYDSAYGKTGILDSISIIKPTKSNINQYSLSSNYGYTYIETIYESNSTDKPVSDILLKAK